MHILKRRCADDVAATGKKSRVLHQMTLAVYLAVVGAVVGASATTLHDCDSFYDLDIVVLPQFTHSPDETALARRFDVAEVVKYEEWFTEETVLTLPQAGQYRGPDDIREYVNFARADSPFVDLDLQQTATSTLLGLTNATCSFRVLRLVKFRISDKFTEDGPTFLLANMINLDFRPATQKITQLGVYFDVEYLDWIFSDQLGNAAVWNWICAVMEDHCYEAVWSKDATLTSRDACVAKMAALPLIGDDPERHFDGNTAACRVLHSVFAASNAHHCAHISFLPLEDPDGNVKCQESLGLEVSDYFADLDVENFEQFKDALDMPERGYERIEDYLDAPRVKAPFGRAFESYASPLSHLSDKSFAYGMAIVAWATVMYTGFMSEVVFGLALYRRFGKSRHRPKLDRWWILAQFLHPIFLLVALVSQASYGYLFLAAGVWKIGHPEVLYYMVRCFGTAKRTSLIDRVHGFFGGFGLAIHHATASWVIVCVIQHLLPLDRITLSVCVPLVIQHTTSLIKYSSYAFYIAACLLVEVWFEWEVLYYRNKRDRNHMLSSWCILLAHWMFIADYALEILVSLCERTSKMPSKRADDGREKKTQDDEERPPDNVCDASLSKASATARENDRRSSTERRPTITSFLSLLSSLEEEYDDGE